MSGRRLRFGRVVSASGPTAFAFTDLTSVPLSTQYASAPVTLEGGGGGPWTVTVSDGEYSINGGAYTSASGSAGPGDTIAVRRTSSASLATAVSATVNVGTTSDTFSLTTVVNTEASAFITRLRAKTADPGSSRRGHYDAVFTSLKVGPVNGTNLLAEMDALYLFQAIDEVSARENLVADAYHLTATGSPSFEQNMGFTGGSGIYLSTGFNPSSVVGEKWGGSAAHIMLYSRTDSLGDTYDFGQATGGSVTRWSLRNSSAGVSRAIVNNASLFNAGSNTTSVGTFVLNRTGSTTVSLYQNGVLSGSPATTGAASSTNGVFAILGNAVSPTSYSTRQISACSFGADLTANQVADLHAIITDYGTLAELGDPGPPAILTSPVVTGIAAVGQVLTASDGTYTGNPVPTVTKQWTRNGVAIVGETGDTYTIVTGDIGDSIQCGAVGTNIHGATAVNPSNIVVPEEFMSITNDGDAATPGSWDNACALIAASGTTAIEVKVYIPSDATHYSQKVFGTGYLLSGDTADQVITFQAAVAGVSIDRVHCLAGGNSTKHFNDFDIMSRQTPMTSDQPCTYRVSHPGEIYFNRCTIRGNNRGAPPPAEIDFDCTSSAYPEYAHVRPVVVGGVITDITIVYPNIGTNWGDQSTDTGTATITVINTVGGTGTTKTGVGTNATGWSLNIVGGVITSVNAGTGGTLYRSDVPAIDLMLDIDGRDTWQDLLDFGFRSGGTAGGRVYFYDCEFDWLSRGIVTSQPNVTAEGCTFDRLWGDALQIECGTGGGPVRLRWNFFKRCLGLGTDFGNPHADFVQLTAATATSDVLIDIEGNVGITALARAYFQGLLISNMNSSGSAAYSGRVANNLLLLAGASISIDFSRTRDLYLGNNTCARWDINDPINDGTTATISFRNTSSGSVISVDNVAEAVTLAPPNVYRTGNVAIARVDPVAYADAFFDYDSQPTTISAAVTAFMTQGAAAGKGAVRTGSPVNFVARTVDVSGEVVYAKFSTYLDAPISTAVQSAWVKIIGGPATGAYSVTGSGFAVEFADDNLGTNPVSGGTSGTYTRDKYIRATLTTGAVNNTTETGTITLGGFAYTWSVITASASSYTGIDNQGAAWSLLANPGLGTATNHNMAVFSMEARLDVLSDGKMFFARTTSNDQAVMVSPNVFQFALSTGGVNGKTETTLAANTWYRITVLVDTTTQRVEVLINGDKAIMTTATTTLNGSINLNTLFNSAPGVGLFADRAGTSTAIMNGRMRYLYWHSWNKADRANLSIPAADTAGDVTDWYLRFAPDNIGADGSGVLEDSVLGAEQPLGCWKFDPTDADGAGQANLGSVGTATFVKQAGTYVAA